MRAGLRMNVMANPGCEKIDFELASPVVSAINGRGIAWNRMRDAAEARRAGGGDAERGAHRGGAEQATPAAA